MNKNRHSLFNLLIVEDDSLLMSTLKLMIPEQFKVYSAQDPDMIPDHVFFHAAIIDMHLKTKNTEPADGPAVMSTLSQKNPQIEIIAISGDLTRDNMHLAMKAGSQRFLAKPINPEELELVLAKALAWCQLLYPSSENRTGLVGESESSQSLKKQIAQLKKEPGSVLIEAETGSGKEVVARSLHQQEGPRPYVVVNCSALTETVFESEFFGHVKGAFTGADQNKIGLAEAAHGGDLFLDEIEALPLSQQAKLLRFIESGEVRKVGDKSSTHVNVRIIAASNEPLEKMVNQKQFREDLYHRLAQHRITIKPLRERPHDLADLAKYFLDLQRPRYNKVFSEEAIQYLKTYSWPGNVRELKRICEQLCLISPLPIIEINDIRKVLPEQFQAINSTETYSKSNLSDFLNEQEKLFLTFHLKQNSNLDDVCHKLQISKSNLYKKIKDYGIHYE